jgi:beta-galactosidase
VAHGSDTVQYFQFRKSRGSCEKFHGAVIDHEGTEHTRVFGDIAGVGKRLAALSGVAGADTPSRVALIYDWNTRWALDDVKGFLQDKTDYPGAVLSHYRAFWQLGIPVDIIDSTRDFAKYAMVVSPMLYLLRDGVADRLSAFVEQGGVYVATYATGYVNNTDLCFQGGFPGPLTATLGIWNEEIDALFPADRNSVEWQGKSYAAFDLCELIHTRGAETLAVYGSDFYAGRPVLTKNHYGRGAAYYIAARTGQDFLEDFYRAACADAGIKPLLEAALPRGVSVQMRSSGKTDFLFVMNCTPSPQTVNAGPDGTLTLAPYEVRILERQTAAEQSVG